MCLTPGTHFKVQLRGYYLVTSEKSQNYFHQRSEFTADRREFKVT